MSLADPPDENDRNSRSLIEDLAGSELSSVVFVADYVQFVFQPANSEAVGHGRLSAYTLPALAGLGGESLRHGDSGYVDGLVDLISHVVVRASENLETLRLDFDDGHVLVISLHALDATGVEAAELTLEGPARWMVWRPNDIAER